MLNSFDANGSQTARGADSFSWDAANRLASATVSGQASSFSYNGDNLRTSRTVGGTTTSFVWDVNAAIPKLLDDGTQYIYGAGLVSHITASGSVYYLADGLGSTMAITDSTGTVAQSYTYDVFGTVRASTGTQSNEFQFAGEQSDPSGLQYLRARYYDSTTGRLLSRDLLSFGDPAGHHPYSYGGNNPALNSDPSGLDFINIYDTSSACPCYPIGAYDPDTGTAVSYGNAPTESCNCDLPTADTAQSHASVTRISGAPSIADVGAHSVAGGTLWEVSASFVPSPEPDAGEDTSDTCRCIGIVRVQLQQQKGKTIHHGSRVIEQAGGVTVQQAIDAMWDIFDDPSVSIPGSIRDTAIDTLNRAAAFLTGLPPYGVPQVWKKSFYFNLRDPKHSWRWDVESLWGSENFRR